MGGISDFIFGGDSSASTESKDLISGEQRSTLNDLLALLSGEVGDFNKDPGLTDRESLAQAELDKFISSGLGGAQEGLTSAIGGGATDFNDFFNKSVQAPAVRAFQRDVLPEIGRNFSGSFFGSERRRADRNATDDLLRSLNENRSKLAFETSESDKNRQLEALGLVPGITDAFGASTQLADVGETKRKRAFDERMQLINSLLGGSVSPTRENIVTTKEGQTGIIGQVLGGVAAGLL